jgi:hypothetical protein
MTNEKKAKTPEKEIDKLQKQFDQFDNQVKELTMDRMNQAPVEEVEPQTKLSSKEIEKAKQIYLKPDKVISDRQKFNEKFREQWNYDKEYVQFIAENKELIGENIEIWTHPYGGMGAEFWKVPTNKPVWGPRYLAEQIRRKSYNRLRMDENRMTSSDGSATYFGSMVADTKIQRLSAEPVVSTKKSVFMGKASGF